MHIINARQLHVGLHSEQLVEKNRASQGTIGTTTCCVLDMQVLSSVSSYTRKATNMINRQNLFHVVWSLFSLLCDIFRYIHVHTFCKKFCGSGGEWGKGGGGGGGGSGCGWRVPIPPEAAHFSLKDDYLG